MRKKSESKHYASNKSLLVEMQKYKNTCKWDEKGKFIEGSGYISQELGFMIQSIATKYASKGNFSGYTWKDDMIGDAILTCIKYMHNFKPERSKNPFAYFTQIIHNSFLNSIKKQKKHSKIKDSCYKRGHILNEGKQFSDKGINYELLKED